MPSLQGGLYSFLLLLESEMYGLLTCHTTTNPQQCFGGLICLGLIRVMIFLLASATTMDARHMMVKRPSAIAFSKLIISANVVSLESDYTHVN